MTRGLFPPAGGGGALVAIGSRGDKVVTEPGAPHAAPVSASIPVGDAATAEELSTLSTPPTVRTTVETEEDTSILNLDPRRAREEVLGGSGGEEGEPSAAAGAVDASWARAESSRAYCKLGRCGYANLDRAGGPDRYLSAIGCDGYHASRSTDADGRVTVRWDLCPRHRAWWRAERSRRAAERPRAGGGKP